MEDQVTQEMEQEKVQTQRKKDQEPGQALAIVEREKEKEQTGELTSWAEGLAFIEKHINDKKLGRAEQARLELAFRHNPNLWRVAGDLAVQTENNMVEKMTSQAVVEAAIKQGIRQMRDTLGHKDAPMLEKLLIEQVIMCWLNLNAIQRAYDQHMLGSGMITLTSGMYWEKRLTMAQDRYEKAAETLAKVRKLSRAMPLQVNIGGQQINVAGEVRSSDVTS